MKVILPRRFFTENFSLTQTIFPSHHAWLQGAVTFKEYSTNEQILQRKMLKKFLLKCFIFQFKDFFFRADIYYLSVNFHIEICWLSTSSDEEIFLYF